MIIGAAVFGYVVGNVSSVVDGGSLNSKLLGERMADVLGYCEVSAH